MNNKSEAIHLSMSKDLKQRLIQFSDSNEISQSGAIRMILSQNLPEAKGGNQ